MTSLSRPPPPVLQLPPQSPGLQGPTGGILINRYEDERTLPRRSPTDPPSPIRIAAPGSGISRARPKSVSLPPATTTSSPSVDTPGQGSSPRIRFAPLPDPAVHGRTLSTSRPDQDHVSEVRNLGPGGADNDQAVDDDDEDTDEDYDWDQDTSGRRRSWAVTMGMGSWKSSSKKLLGGGSSSKSKSPSFGAPLTKSVSQPNSVNSSPFKWTGSNESSSASGRRGSSVGAHRRGASGDSSFGTSPNPSVGARMLNGRVYGARRASEAALQEKINREKLEPAFVEWGPGGHGSTQAAKVADTTGKGIDDDDGGGMAWVRRRREERERKEREEKEAAARAAAAPPSEDVGPMGESLDAEQLGDQRPASLSSSASSVSSPRPAVGPLTPRDGPAEFALPAIHISEPPSKGPAGIDIPRGRRDYSEDDDDNDDEEDDDEEDDEDFPADEDEDEEDDLPDHLRRTCDAAGVEVLSRHK